MANPNDNPYLINFLRQQRYPIVCNDNTTSRTTNPSWPSVFIDLWQDFDLHTLLGHYGVVLSQVHAGIPLVPPLPSSRVEMSSYNFLILHATLEPALQYLQLTDDVCLHHEYSSANQTIAPSSVLGPRARAAVDHAVQNLIHDPKNRVIGIRRPSSTWTGQQLKEGIQNQRTLTATLQWPIRQLAYACKLGGAQYGYIQTEEDLTVCKFDPIGNAYHAFVQSIPWTSGGNNDLTVDLALWWLCMMALRNQ